MRRPKMMTGFLLALALSACGGGEDATGNGAGAMAGAPVAAPQGQQWADVVSMTSDGGIVMGNPDAPLHAIEFGSFTCPHCKDFSAASHDERNEMVNSGRLRFEYRTFVRDPLDMSMALVARCGGAEPFFTLADQIFTAQSEIVGRAQAMSEQEYTAIMGQPEDRRLVSLGEKLGLIEFAKERGLPEAKVKQCLADTAAMKKLVEQVQADSGKYNIEGTPTVLLNGTEIEGGADWAVTRAKLKEAGL